MKLSFTGFNVALVLLLVPGIARADNPDLMTLIGASNAGSTYAARDNSGNDMNENASTYGLSSSDHNSFAVDYGNSGVIRGHGRCSTRAGTDPWSNDTYDIISSNFVDSLTDETGQNGAQYCYCGLDSYTPLNGTATALSGPWVFDFDHGDEGMCAYVCALNCAVELMNDSENSLAFRAAMFNAYAPAGGASGGSAVTTQTYVDNKLATKQAKITTTGTNKLMTYGASTGATPGSRDIVSTLGTSTTATTVPEVGPIVTGLNGKQNTVNGTANFVMTGTGTAGTVGEKPVYSTTNNYTSALVTAQTINTAAATAANSELSCIDNDCLLWQINTSGPAGISTRIYLDPSINGIYNCYKTHTGNQSSQSSCTSAEYAALSNGSWYTKFPYGGIKGIAICSSVVGSASNTVPSAQSTIQTEYNTWKSNGSVGGTHCYCKMTDPEVSGSAWSWAYKSASTTNCKRDCAWYCGSLSQNDVLTRTNIFNPVQ
ncbi:MAG: hypothetical protein J6S80_03850 [Alphaproteobacteria bacterium]|nr:hypothetical protein [Alphaproteobacteria bacterium]